MNNHNHKNPKYVKHGNKKLEAAADTQPIEIQENYDVTFELTDTATGNKSRITKRFHNWERVRNLKDSFELMCFRIAGYSNVAKLIIEEV